MRWAAAERRRGIFRRLLLFFWLLLSCACLLGYAYSRNANLLWIIPLPLLTLISLYFLVFFHEAGHLAFGLFLRFPVTGIEIGTFPFRTVRIGRFLCRTGRLPWWGRTVMGVSPRTFSPARRFFFISGGMIFESFFFLAFYFVARNFLTLELLGLFLLADQVWVNLFPRYEDGRASNDGALLLEIFSLRVRAGQAQSVF